MVPMPAGTKMFPQFLREAGYYCTNNAKEDYNLAKPGQVWDDSSAQGALEEPQGRAAVLCRLQFGQEPREPDSHAAAQADHDPAKVRVPAYHPDTPEVRQDWAQYYDKVSEADADAGELLKELAEAGLADDTIVFYYADHGSGMPRSKRWPYNSGLHVPLVVYIPEKWRAACPEGISARRQVGPAGQLRRFGADGAEPGRRSSRRRGCRATPSPASFRTAPQPYVYGFRGRMDERCDLVRSVTDGRYVYVRNYYPHVSTASTSATCSRRRRRASGESCTTKARPTPAQSIFLARPKAPEELYDLQNDPRRSAEPGRFARASGQS